MTWHKFLLIHFLTSLVLLFVSRKLLQGKMLKLLRIIASAFALSFFIDYPAEDREIWTFSQASASTIIEVPIENMVFIASCVPYIIMIYLAAQSLVRSRAWQSKIPKA